MPNPEKPMIADRQASQVQQPPASGHDEFVAEGLAKFRAATSERLSHAVVSFNDLEAGIAGLLSHLWQRRPAEVPDVPPAPVPVAEAAKPKAVPPEANPPEGEKAGG